jgi:hypothetical protein
MLKRIRNIALVCAVVLFSYAAAAAQDTTSTTPTKNPRVVVTDNLAKPTTPSSSTQPTAGTTKTTKVGNFSINITEGVTGQNMENGKYVTVTKWDGSKWVSKREWVQNTPPASKPNP